MRGSWYLHRSASSFLDGAATVRLEQAVTAVVAADWNVVRISSDNVGLLQYEDFRAVAFPALLQSWKVRSDGGSAYRDFRSAKNPVILHRKELLVTPQETERSVWGKLTSELERRGLFRDPHLIGRRNAWDKRLSEAGICIKDHVICQISV